MILRCEPSFGTPHVLAGANPKNLLLAVGAAAAIAEIAIPGGEQAVAYAVFALIGTIGVGAPVVLYVALSERAGPILDRLKGWMASHNAVIMAVLCLVIGRGVHKLGRRLGGRCGARLLMSR
jgi:hypothetical protein